MLTANNSLPSAFCRALGKNFAECWNDSQQKKGTGKGRRWWRRLCRVPSWESTRQRFFFGDDSDYKQRMWQIMRKFLNFLPQPPHMISWDLDESHDFSKFICFKPIPPHVRGHVSWTRCLKFPLISRIWPHIGLNNMNTIFHSFYSIIWITCSSNLTYP